MPASASSSRSVNRFLQPIFAKRDGQPSRFLLSPTGSGRNLKQVLTRLSEFVFPTIAATFPSDYSVEDSARELRAASVGFGFDAVFTRGVAKDSSKVCVRLDRRSRFIGTLEHNGQKTVLVGRFPPSGWFKFYHTAGLVFSVVIAVLMLWGALFGKLLVWWGPLAPVGMFAAELGMFRLNQWFDRKNVVWLSHKIEYALTEASRRPQPNSKPGWLEKKLFALTGQ